MSSFEQGASTENSCKILRSNKNIGFKCSLCGDHQKNSVYIFHRYPKDPEMSNRWAVKSEKKWVISASVSARYNRFRVCSKHFVDQDCCGPQKRRLHPDAVPKSYPDITNPLNADVKLSKLQSVLQESLLGEKSDNTVECSEQMDCSYQLDVSEEMDCSNILNNATNFLTSTPKRKNVTKGVRIITPKTKKIKSLSSKVFYLKRKYEKKTDLKKSTIQHVLNSIKSVVKPVIHNFIASQLKSTFVSKYGHRWNVRDKNLALQIYLASPKTYRILSQYFHLPSKTTLLKCLSNIKVGPGFSKTVLNAVKFQTSKMKPHDKYCIVSFDEMKLKPGLSYNVKNDLIDGFVNYGCYDVSDPKLATHALVFMVRGLCKKWKQVFGYFFSSESASSTVLKHLLNEGLSALIDCDLKPIAIVCDQGSNNQRLYAKELGISVDEPYFFVKGRKIYSLFDTPHLLKCVRNNFKRYPVKFKSNNNFKIANWEHIKYAWEFDSKLTHKFLPKLTRRHIEVDGLSAMNVRLAAQVLSQSVASSLCYLSATGQLPAAGCHSDCFPIVILIPLLASTATTRGFV